MSKPEREFGVSLPKFLLESFMCFGVFIVLYIYRNFMREGSQVFTSETF